MHQQSHCDNLFSKRKVNLLFLLPSAFYAEAAPSSRARRAFTQKRSTPKGPSALHFGVFFAHFSICSGAHFFPLKNVEPLGACLRSLTLYFILIHQGVAQSGSVSVLGTEGHRFESCHLEQKIENHIMKINRPLSPHLTIYKPQLTSTLSIFHRISGGFLVVILLFTLLYLKICDLGLSSYPIYLCLFYITSYFDWFLFSITNLALFAFCYHLSNGIRHLLWDFGFFLDLSKVYISGAFVLLLSVLLLIVLNIFVFSIW